MSTAMAIHDATLDDERDLTEQQGQSALQNTPPSAETQDVTLARSHRERDTA